MSPIFTKDLPLSQLKQRWTSSDSQFIELDGMQVHFRDEGLRSDPTPLVLIHGTGSSLHTWDGWVARLKDSHRIIRFDRPGFGLTGPNPSHQYSMEYYSGFVQQLLARLRIDQCILVGNSSGGRIAWHVAAQKPILVEHLILLAPGGYPRTTPLPLGLRISMSPLLSLLLERILPKSAVEKGIRSMYGNASKVTQEVIDRNYELTLREGNRKANGETLRQAQSVNDSNLIKTINVPTLIMWGDRDTVIPSSDGTLFNKDIASSKLVVVKGVGHLAQEEAPDETVAELKEFISR